MKLYIMKRDALEAIKNNLPNLYAKYYTEKNNKWIAKIYGEDPFIEFKEVPDFTLASLDADLSPGEIDLNNCKILYEKLMFLSESQASDERLWAGLSHTVFYDYMRIRWGYGKGNSPKDADKEAGAIKTRFFYRNTGRNGFYRNTLAKCWWVGHNTYNPSNSQNHFENLDIIGSNDFNSKITEFFYNFTFSSNPEVMAAIIDTLRYYKEEGKKISVRNHIRPALSYLNAVGGSVVIDCLSKEEITSIFSDAIDAIIQGDTPTLNLENSSDVDDIDALTLYKQNLSTENISRKIVLGCQILVQNNQGKRKTYSYDYNKNGELPDTVKLFTNHTIGDKIKIGGESWKIEDIII